MNKNLMFIGLFLGERLYIETSDVNFAELAGKTLTTLILRENKDVESAIENLKKEKQDE